MGDPVLHLSMPVADLVEARQFYVDVLGCMPGRVRQGWMDVWFYGMQITLHERPDEVLPDDSQGVRHFGAALDRAEFDAVLRRLDGAPVRWIGERTTFDDWELSGKTNVKLADPSGNVIELKYYDDPTALETGEPAG